MPLSTDLVALSRACWAEKGGAAADDVLRTISSTEKGAKRPPHQSTGHTNTRPTPAARGMHGTHVGAALGHGVDLVGEVGEEAAAALGQQALALGRAGGGSERRHEGEEGRSGEHRDAHAWKLELVVGLSVR